MYFVEVEARKVWEQRKRRVCPLDIFFNRLFILLGRDNNNVMPEGGYAK